MSIIRKIAASLIIGACALTTAGAEGCQGPPGSPDPNDGYKPTIVSMKHEPKVEGHWGKITFVKKRECWAIRYHNPYNNDIVKRCVELKTYRKYRVGQEYHG